MDVADSLSYLIDALGVKAATAQELLGTCDGDVSRAIQRYFDLTAAGISSNFENEVVVLDDGKDVENSTVAGVKESSDSTDVSTASLGVQSSTTSEQRSDISATERNAESPARNKVQRTNRRASTPVAHGAASALTSWLQTGKSGSHVSTPPRAAASFTGSINESTSHKSDNTTETTSTREAIRVESPVVVDVDGAEPSATIETAQHTGNSHQPEQPSDKDGSEHARSDTPFIGTSDGMSASVGAADAGAGRSDHTAALQGDSISGNNTTSSATNNTAKHITPVHFTKNPNFRSVDTPIWEYDPVLHACWIADTRTTSTAPYLHLSKAFELIETTNGRIRIASMLVNMFRTLLALAPAEVYPAVLLMTGQLGSAHEGFVMNIGSKTLTSAISECTSVPGKQLAKLYYELGDLGDVAERCWRAQRLLVPPAPLSIGALLTDLRALTFIHGSGSGSKKTGLVLKILRRCRESEIRYVVRMLVQNMRIGVNMVTALTSLARAIAFNEATAPSCADCNGNDTIAGTCTHCSSKAGDKAATVTGPKAKAGAKRKAAAETTLIETTPQHVIDAMDAAAAQMKRCFSECPDVERLVKVLVGVASFADIGPPWQGPSGMASLIQHCIPKPGTPVRPMLAKITNGCADALGRFAGRAFACEWKYDGQRAQIHCSRDGADGSHQIKIYSRNLDDTTDRWPDVVEAIERAAIAASGARAPLLDFIVDAEVVAVELRDGCVRILPFQTLSTRAKTGMQGVQDVTVRACVFAFDCLFLNGESLVTRDFETRREIMRASFVTSPGIFEFAQGIDLVGPDASAHTEEGFDESEGSGPPSGILAEMEAELQSALAGSCEGLMIKLLRSAGPDAMGSEEIGSAVAKVAAKRPKSKSARSDKPAVVETLVATYQPSVRSNSWLKVKRDYCSELADSLDLVPIGGWFGNGRKAGWFSPILVACYNPETEEWESVCRCMSGFTDAFYQEMTEYFKKEENQLDDATARKLYRTGETPHVWFRVTGKVWEMKGADMTISPVHMAANGLIHPSKGISMRFPRFIRERLDKSPDDASTSETIADLYRAQTRKLEVADDLDM